MSKFILFSLAFFLGPVLAESAQNSGASKTFWRDLDLQNGCSISRHDLSEGRRYPGNFCVFLPDGTFISAGNLNLRRIGADGKSIWEIPAKIHHQLSLSLDGKKILGIGSEVSVTMIGRRRFDLFLIYDLNGKELHRRSAESLFAEAEIPFYEGRLLPPIEKFHGVAIEGSHFNSIQEIPVLKKKSHPSFLPGNIIVNGLGSGIFILSPDLQKTLSHFKIPNSIDHQVHDVQVRSNGDFLFFNNVVDDPFEKVPHSQVQTWDPVRRKTGLAIGPTPGPYFHSPVSGSVQELSDGTLLFSHMFAGGFFTTPKGKVVGSFVGGIGNPPVLVPFQHVRALDHSEFLRKNHLPSKH